jgi:hypothetical protein
MWTNIKAWFRNSLTIAWARFKVAAGIIGAGLVVTFSSFDINQLATMDKYTAVKILGFAVLSGVVTEACRRRSLPKC